MNEKEINEIVNEHYGFTIEEIDEDLGKALLRIKQLEYSNENLQQENSQLKEQRQELRSWLEEQYLRSDDYSDYETAFKMVSNKLNELEGKNE